MDLNVNNETYYRNIFSSKIKDSVDKTNKNAKEIAKKAYEAMEGAGTDEEALQEALVGLSPEEAKAVENEFANLYDGASITNWIKGDTSGDLEKTLLSSFENKSNSKNYFDAKATAKIVHESIDGWGTDEDSLKSALENLTKEEADKVKAEYKNLYNTDMESDIKGDTSGKLETYLLSCLSGKTANQTSKKEFDPTPIARKLFNALEGAGTDEIALENALYGLTPDQIEKVSEKFEELCGKDLKEWIKSDTSGDLEDKLMEVFE